MSIRAASANDRGFLEHMLAIAADWRPGTPVRPVEQVVSEPHLARYVEGWPRPGDFGVIADDAHGRPVGAAWCRTFSAEDPGYGFVSAMVPELTIGVVADERGNGIGRRLMSSLLDAARERGVARLSLSVELDNHAMGLYSDLGFTVVETAAGSATMTIDLG